VDDAPTATDPSPPLDSPAAYPYRWGEPIPLFRPLESSIQKVTVMRTSMRLPTLAGILALTVAGVTVPSTAHAQGAHYTTTTRLELAGAMGTMMGALSDNEPTVSETWVQDGMMRTDDGSTSTIVNLVEGTLLVIDHESRTFFRTSFAEMMAASQQAMDQVGAAATAPEDPAAASGQEAAESPTLEADYSFDMDRTGERRTVGEYDAERVIVTMEIDFEAESEDGERVEALDMVMINDMWVSSDFPSAETIMAEAAMEGGMAWAGEMSAAGAGGFDEIMAANPRMGAAMERMAEEMDGLEGTTIESRAYVVTVAPGQELDRDAVLALNDQPLSEGLGSVLGDAAGDAAENAARDAARDRAAEAARGAMGRLGGLLGRRNNDEEEKEDEEELERRMQLRAQTVLSRITTTLTSVEMGPFPAEVFQPDPDYTERRPEWLGGG
jgi:hypothetical protein